MAARGRADVVRAIRGGHPGRKLVQLPTERERSYRIVRPEEFYNALDSVVSQNALKTKLASTFYQYTLYLNDPAAGKPNMLVYGRSGSGKTYAVERCIEAAGLPMTIASLAALAPPGYRGRVFIDMLIEHWRRWRTDKGVIFLDEVDKLCVGSFRQTQKGRQNREVSEIEKGGVAMQMELLKHMERELVSFTDEAKDIPELEDVVFDTGNIFWIFAGAFVGMEKYIRARLHNPFLDEEDVYENAIPVDFRNYGMTQEFGDRVQTWAWTKPLKVQEMMQILRQQDEPRWQKRLRTVGCELELQDGALGACAQHAWQMKEGPRVARAMLTRSMDDIVTEASLYRSQHPDWPGRVTVDVGSVQSSHIHFGGEA